MKKAIFIIFMFCIFLPSKSFASEIYGWWKSEENNIKTPDLIKITKNKFCGLDYKILNNSNNIIKISLANSNDITIIKIHSDDKISITTVNGDTSSYKSITQDISLTRKEVEELAKMH